MEGHRFATIAGLVLALAGCASTASPAAPGDAASDALVAVDAARDASVDGGGPSCAPRVDVDASYVELTVAGDVASTSGIFNPSLVYPPDAASGLMTYSSVSGGLVHTRIAASSDQGATWTYVADVNTTAAATITTADPSVCGDAGACTGSFVHEVSSLVVDPTDPNPARLLKVFTHTYFWNGVLHYDIGDIDLYTAPGASGPWAQQKLIGWPSSSPESSSGITENIATTAALAPLAGCALLTEPGALLRPSSLDLAVGCVYPDDTIEIELLRSVDHGVSFFDVSTLVSVAEAADLGATKHQINAPDLFTMGGATYLVASPDGPVSLGATEGDGYSGCLVFPFADVNKGDLARCGGQLVVASSYERNTGRFAGACTAAEGSAATGMIVPIADLTSAAPFKVFATGRTPP